jgi:hypothetical protein
MVKNKKVMTDHYGFGPVRTLTEYEEYSGLLFEKRAIDKYTLDKNYPPNPYNLKQKKSGRIVLYGI